MTQRFTVNFPDSSDDWTSIIQDVCKCYQIHDPDQVFGLVNKLKTGMQFLRVHAECNLIAYLETSRNNDAWTSVPTFSYIAVSKLCCKPCYLWIKAFNI